MGKTGLEGIFQLKIEGEGGKERESPEDGGGCKCRNAYASAGVTYETSFLNVEK